MRVAAVQHKARPSFDASVQSLARVVRAAAGADLIVAPEMALRGYAFTSLAAVEAVAEPADGPTLAALGPLAREVGAWLVVGFPERDGDALHNSALIVAPDGQLAHVYRKSLLFEADLPWATAGRHDYPLVDTGRGVFTVGICMDLNDDRFLAWCAARRPDVIAFPTNWIQEDGSLQAYWQTRLATGWSEDWAHLPEVVPGRAPVDAVIVGANSYGREGAWDLRGQSSIVSRRRVYGVADRTGDSVLIADLGAFG
ncbi:MAG: carbon-nitrogen hydrolase family protein [Alphaproteobacteria bacterium]|nr:carbon-nitrogen hydrolase family protein [Alphaproteobacteria bacterium]